MFLPQKEMQREVLECRECYPDLFDTDVKVIDRVGVGRAQNLEPRDSGFES